MSEFVQVINKGGKTYKEEFKGKMIELAPGKSIKMERTEAVQFVGSVGSSNVEKGIEKNLEIIRGPIPVPEAIDQKFVSHLDGKVFDTQKELDDHLKSINPEDKGATVLQDDEADTAAKRRKMMRG